MHFGHTVGKGFPSLHGFLGIHSCPHRSQRKAHTSFSNTAITPLPLIPLPPETDEPEEDAPVKANKIHSPDKGVLLAWGLDIDDEGPDIIAAWSPGHKGAARALAMLIHDHREQLQAAGVDLTTLRITANNGHSGSRRASDLAPTEDSDHGG